ncbi:sigma-70 family RNA polymerase sigma factor [Actinospica sp. MGRD01-02]|uniref:Sigma-70 family RNA polymerase sigma factor n=1 Tax=Actinospica acidithermotolerans TaxID=2828514 RepID=A0A941EGX0_9ACTN|nr:sigma-70 family RNA polymerase sigma factor [Actinospica acidithermotolerans]MBR7830543.1 sigma-70 family RNA polymerase sigma factor [Actinospica acidithermotolerans]
MNGANGQQATDQDALAARFEADRLRLRGVAYRMLGSLAEAEDAVQEAWLRLARTDTDEVANLSGWLTTVVARVCLDQLRSRKSRREDPAGMRLPEQERVEAAAVATAAGSDPEEEALLADTVGVALLVVLDTLSPAERLAFVLHDLFGVSFDEIAPIVDRTPTATRQLASRARRRVQGRSPEVEADRARQREVLDAFLAASREGEFEALLAVLDPDVVFHGDEAAERLGGEGEMRGARRVAEAFCGRARVAEPALLDGELGVLVAPRGNIVVVMQVTFREGRISEIYAVADHDAIDAMELERLA